MQSGIRECKVSRFSNQSGTSGKNLADSRRRFGNRWRRHPSHNRRSGVKNLRSPCSETAAGSGKNQKVIRNRTEIKNGGISRHQIVDKLGVGLYTLYVHSLDPFFFFKSGKYKVIPDYQRPFHQHSVCGKKLQLFIFRHIF